MISSWCTYRYAAQKCGMAVSCASGHHGLWKINHMASRLKHTISVISPSWHRLTRSDYMALLITSSRGLVLSPMTITAIDSWLAVIHSRSLALGTQKLSKQPTRIETLNLRALPCLLCLAYFTTQPTPRWTFTFCPRGVNTLETLRDGAEPECCGYCTVCTHTCNQPHSGHTHTRRAKALA